MLDQRLVESEDTEAADRDPTVLSSEKVLLMKAGTQLSCGAQESVENRSVINRTLK